MTNSNLRTDSNANKFPNVLTLNFILARVLQEETKVWHEKKSMLHLAFESNVDSTVLAMLKVQLIKWILWFFRPIAQFQIYNSSLPCKVHSRNQLTWRMPKPMKQLAVVREKYAHISSNHQGTYGQSAVGLFFQVHLQQTFETSRWLWGYGSSWEEFLHQHRFASSYHPDCYGHMV